MKACAHTGSLAFSCAEMPKGMPFTRAMITLQTKIQATIRALSTGGVLACW